MKTKFVTKSIGCVLTAIMMLQITPCASAHKTSQEGILAKTYIENRNSYYIGGDDVGWRIIENSHTNGTSITYSFSSTDEYLSIYFKYNTTYKDYVLNGAAKWKGTVTITNKEDGSGKGEISTYYEKYSGTVAKACDFVVDTSSHLTSWKIKMNRAYSDIMSDRVLAHEFGHIIGLTDLYESKSSNKLMYYNIDGTATDPTTADKLGAQVITGQHTSHTWGYKYYNTTTNGTTRHVKYCTICYGYCSSSNGIDPLVSNCSYNAANICFLCKARKKEIQINSIE